MAYEKARRRIKEVIKIEIVDVLKQTQLKIEQSTCKHKKIKREASINNFLIRWG